VLLLAGLVGGISDAPVSPGSAVTSVVERRRCYVDDLSFELPGESSGSAESVHVLATTVSSVSSTDACVTGADWLVVDCSDDNINELPGEALSSADSVPLLAPSVGSLVLADS